jgi:hypothetical protein
LWRPGYIKPAHPSPIGIRVAISRDDRDRRKLAFLCQLRRLHSSRGVSCAQMNKRQITVKWRRRGRFASISPIDNYAIRAFAPIVKVG